MKSAILTINSILVLASLLASPHLVFGEETKQPKKELLQQVRMIVSGLKCESCIPDVRKCLNKVPGVRSAKVTRFDKTGSSTIVEVTPGSVSGDQLIAALKASGFRAEVKSISKPREVVLENESGFNFFGLF